MNSKAAMNTATLDAKSHFIINYYTKSQSIIYDTNSTPTLVI